MSVGVDESGQYRASGEVDLTRSTGRKVEDVLVGAYRDNPVARDGNCLGTFMCSQFAIKIVDMRFHCTFSNDQQIGDFFIGKTFSIKGTSSITSKYSETYSFRIEGANGRKLYRRLIFAFNRSLASARRGSANMERAPNARGPNSARPLNQPTTPALIN